MNITNNIDKSISLIVKYLSSNPLFRNVSANLIGYGWNGLLILIATPWYVSILGMEGYGLLGFWLLMHIVFSLFDFGLGATVVREFATSTHHNGADRRRNLLRTLEYVYWPLAVMLTIALVASADWIAHNWLKLYVLSPTRTAIAIKWMALALGLQFPCALYANGLAGLQCQGRMNALQMLGNGLRHGVGVAVLCWKADLVWFFFVQTFVTGLQTSVTWVVLWRLLYNSGQGRPVFRFSLLKEVWRFSAGMAFTMIAGVLLINTDRLFLSKLLPTEELGKYTLAWTLSSFLQIGIQPFYRAYFPRFAESIALNNSERLRKEYYQGCLFAAWIIIPSAVIGGIFAPEIFFAWIGSSDATVVKVFRWLLIGVAGAGLMWLPAAFQQAHGWTRLHATMIAGALCIGIPCLWFAIRRWGTVGATTIWVLHGISDVTLGLWLMHRRLLKGEFFNWYRTVVFPPLLICILIAGLSWWLMPTDLNRWVLFAWIGSTGSLTVLSLFTIEKYKIRSKYE